MQPSDANHKVLIVEDDDDIRQTFSELLGDAGYTPICACNGAEALDRLQRPDRPCVIVLDLMMPVMTGWQFLEHRQKEPSLLAIPVIVVSAARGDVPAGATAYLRKPMSAETFVGLVRRHCPGEDTARDS